MCASEVGKALRRSPQPGDLRRHCNRPARYAVIRRWPTQARHTRVSILHFQQSSGQFRRFTVAGSQLRVIWYYINRHPKSRSTASCATHEPAAASRGAAALLMEKCKDFSGTYKGCCTRSHFGKGKDLTTSPYSVCSTSGRRLAVETDSLSQRRKG